MRPDTVRQCFAIISLFLVLGVIANIAVAWIISLTVNPFDTEWRQSTRRGVHETISIWVAERRGTTWAASARFFVTTMDADGEPHSFHGTTLMPEELAPAWSGLPSRRVDFSTLTVPFIEDRYAHATGWPMLGLMSEHHAAGVDGGVLTTLQPYVGGGFSLGRALPLRPIWPGFATNTLLYTVVLCLLVFGTSTLRRAIRHRRGQCERCAYPIGVSTVCTECGHPLDQPSKCRIASSSCGN